MGERKKFQLSTKILLLTLSITFSISIISVSIMIRNDLQQYKNVVNLFNDIIESSSAISSNMIDNDSENMIYNLKKLKLNPNIVSTEIFRFNGQKFTKVFSSEKDDGSDIKIMGSPKMKFTFLDKKLEIMYPIMQHNSLVGAMYIKTLISTNYVISIIEIICLKTLIAMFFAIFLSSIMNKPITLLLTAMQSVINKKDYSVRVKSKNYRKVDALTNTFNNMLESIQQQELMEHISQEQIKYLAYYNPTTGLPNLELFKELLHHVLINAKRNKQIFAVMYLKINDFNNISQVYGRDKSDDFLRTIAQHLQEDSPYISNVANINEGEFIMCIENVHKVEEISPIAKATLDLISQPYTIDTEQIKAIVSMGISLYPKHGNKTEDLIKNAQIDKKIPTDNTLEQNTLVAFYQPQLNLTTKRIDGVELLIANDSGLNIDISAWALQTGCKQCKQWQDNGLTNIAISIKISEQQFATPELLAHVTLALQESGLEPKFLQLELTASAIMTNDAKTLNTLSALKNLGLKLAIDDFGTGYLSLRYLAQYPIDVLKINQAFVNHLIENKNDAIIAKTIISLAHNFNLFVIADGVETQEQLEYLTRHDCDAVQGKLISKPLSTLEMTDFLKKHGESIYAAGT